MQNRALLCSALFIAGTLFAQQPIPVGKVNQSSRNYRASDGTRLTRSSSDSDLESAINERLSDQPEFREVHASVHRHRVTLTGAVISKDVKRRAESEAGRFVGVRTVKNDIKIGDLNASQPAVVSTSAQ